MKATAIPPTLATSSAYSARRSFIPISLLNRHPGRPCFEFDVERDPHEPGFFELHEKLARHRQTVRIDDRFVPASRHPPHDGGEIGVDERVATGDRHSIEASQPFEDVQIGLDGLE